MAGDTDNVAVWSEADVLIGSLTATDPAAGAAFTLNDGTTVTTEWDFAGILDGSAGFSETQSNDSTDFPGWGVGTVATSRKNLTVMRTFTVLEDNPITLGLRYDTSGVTFNTTGGFSGYTGTLAGRDLNEKFKVAFETRSGDVVKRLISANYAQIETIGDVAEGEDNTASFAVTVKIYPNAAGEFWETYKGAAA